MESMLPHSISVYPGVLFYVSLKTDFVCTSLFSATGHQLMLFFPCRVMNVMNEEGTPPACRFLFRDWMFFVINESNSD